MNIMKSRLIMAAFMAMAWNQTNLQTFERRYSSPAWQPKRTKFKGWQRQAREAR